ncbi:cation transport protein ChaC [Shimia abyssi]|uniref:glutathione-specific gamma-glutamylcyclotransferase n=2 Tax=Shimia abyssi TaxID=1662395 RepID=A0A2P8FBG9_9RHOB|nr:cation transport protein ChaC [Shimia abyssi]
MRDIVTSNGAPQDWILTTEQRNADRFAALAGRWDQDVWVFAYGSLMWDPGFHFAEVRRGFAPRAERRFTLCDRFGGRGTRDAPGVMAALENGSGCNGLVFRISRDIIDVETELVWRRERMGHAYFPAFIEVQTDQGPVEALAFMANHAATLIDTDLTYEQQVQYCATGKGWLGTSLDYVANLAEHFETMRIVDKGVTGLLRDARAYRDRHSITM